MFNCAFANGQSNVMGSLGDELLVLPNGIASYSIPIDVVPGTQGVQPNLQVTYNSLSGRGILGQGWHLSGMSSISRTQKTYYHDGEMSCINFDDNDRYVLDGQRLIKLSSGIYSQTNAVYGSEIENFDRVILKGEPYTLSQYFTTTTDQGYIIEYGNTSDSKLISGDKIVSWFQNRITDPDGNYMTINYGQDVINGEIWPTEISYTGNVNANLTTYAKVKFVYTTDSNINVSYVGSVSAYGGVAIAAQDFAFCNTLGVMTSSTINSLGTKLYTGGKTDLTMSFGIASYNFTQNKWGYIGKKGNSILQNAGYLLGGIYNAVDICKFITWDMLSIEDRFTKLENYAQSHKKEFGEIIMEYKGYKKGKSGDFNPNNKHIYIYKDGLSKGWGWAKSTLCHEVKHKFDFMMSDYINDGNSYIYQLEYKAYGFEVQNAKFNGLSWTQYRKVVNNYYYNARMHEVNNLQLFSNYNFKNYWSWLKNSLGL